MFRYKIWRLIFGICLGFGIWSLGFPSHGATWLDPGLKWKTLETKHFSINYYPEIEDAAYKLAPIAEEVYETMTEVLKYKLDMKTQVTLMDITDYGNGYTTVFPYPGITLYLSDLSGNLNPYKYDNYLRFLFLHEYTHALHLDIAEDGFSVLRKIFGRNIFPNAAEPWFMIEGLATYMETRYTNAGRGRDPRWKMMMRMDVLENNLKSIEQAAVDTVRWPMGNLRYLYGVEFLEYLSKVYGEERIVLLTHVYGDFLFTLGIDAAFSYVFDKDLKTLWSDWLSDARVQYQKQKDALGKLTEVKLLTNDGYYHTKPKWGKDSNALYYIQRNADDYPQMRCLDIKSGRSEKILEGWVFDEAFDLSQDGRYLLFSKADIYKNYYTYKDVYQMDLKDKSLVQLTHGLRASDPSFSPDGNRVVLVKNEKGNKTINLIDQKEPENKFSVPFEAEAFIQYFSPSFSQDSKTLIVAKHNVDGSQKIYKIDAASGSEEVLIKFNLSSTEANPAYSPDGRYVYYDADYNGIVNIYAYDVRNKELFQVTNVLGGAMMPDVSPDGKKLAYVSYSSNGYDLAVSDINAKEWKKIKALPSVTHPPSPSLIKRGGEEGVSSSQEAISIHDYNPFPSLVPRFWIPFSYYNENGKHNSIYIGSFDPLQQHMYYLNLGYDIQGSKPSYSFYYVNNQFPPQISVYLNDSSVPYGLNGQVYWEKEKEAEILFSFIDNRVFNEYSKQMFSFGLKSMNLSNISSLAPFNPQPAQGNLNAFILSYRFVNTRSYPYSISPEDGVDLYARAEVNTKSLNSDYSFINYSGFFKEYFKLPIKRQVLATLLNGFYSRGDQLPQSNFSWKYLTLRGYPSTYLQGNKGASLSFEYRAPFSYIENGVIYGFTFLDRVWGTLFCDLGMAGFTPLDALLLKKSVGAELNLDASTLWGDVPLTFKIGYAKGLDLGGESRLYLNIGL